MIQSEAVTTDQNGLCAVWCLRLFRSDQLFTMITRRMYETLENNQGQSGGVSM